MSELEKLDALRKSIDKEKDKAARKMHELHDEYVRVQMKMNALSGGR